jgi:hypothetical protein
MTNDSDIGLLVVEPALTISHERRVEIRGGVGDSARSPQGLGSDRPCGRLGKLKHAPPWWGMF